jgi:hypothetical protein
MLDFRRSLPVVETIYDPVRLQFLELLDQNFVVTLPTARLSSP